MANLEDLPEEVMMMILLRVPPESLARFKLVAKSWYALINDPKFLDSLPNPNVLLKQLVKNKETGKKAIRFSFLKYRFVVDDFVVEDVHIPFPGKEFHYHTLVHGHSHGLVCLSGGHDGICLYKPATREFRILPPSIIHINRPYNVNDVNSWTNAVGFGYDPKSKDFKVVRVVDFTGPFSKFLRAEVLDLEKNEWREIETPIPGCRDYQPSFEMYYQGFYYWWALDRIESGFIMSFDMSEEVFRMIPAPESFQMYHYKSMGVLNGSIVLFYYPWGADKKSFEVWKMVKDDELVSWSKMFTFSPDSGVEFPVAFVGSHQLLMETNEGQLILYNVNTQRFKHLPLHGGLPSRSQATVFIKTLSSVNLNRGHNHN